MDISESSTREQRYLISVPVVSEKYGLGARANLRMRNVSKSGAMLYILQAVEHFKKGDILRLTVDLFEINKKKIVNAEIIWHEKGKMGVAFVNPDEVISKLFRQPI